jgi:hypothetical protein
MKRDGKTLDDADDVIHGNWLLPQGQLMGWSAAETD